MMGNGVFLINQELVLKEVLELAQLKISGILKTPPGAVQVYCEYEDGVLHPCIDIHPDAVRGVTPVQVRQVIGTIYERLKLDLRMRLASLKRGRDSYHPD